MNKTEKMFGFSVRPDWSSDPQPPHPKNQPLEMLVFGSAPRRRCQQESASWSSSHLLLQPLVLLFLGLRPRLRLLLLPSSLGFVSQALLLRHEVGFLLSALPLLCLPGHGLLSQEPEETKQSLFFCPDHEVVDSDIFQIKYGEKNIWSVRMFLDLLRRSCSRRSCSSLSRCSRACRLFSARARAASSGSLVPADGLVVGATGAGVEAGAGCELDGGGPGWT